MDSEQQRLESTRVKLAEFLQADEPILAAAEAFSGPRIVTFFLPQSSVGGRNYALMFVAGILPYILLLLFVRLTGLAHQWLLAVTPTRLVAARRVRTGRALTGEVRFLEFGDNVRVKATSSFWSGWFLEVETGTQVVKYSVNGYPTDWTGLVKLHPRGEPPIWTFSGFVDTLLDRSAQRR